MTTISHVCDQFFARMTTGLEEGLPVSYRMDRGSRRNLARLLYRQQRRPGLVNPTGPGEKPVRAKKAPHARTVQRPMRHVYKFHEPPAPKSKRRATA